jgi:uncharacterized protein (DUF488 family)
MIECVYTIGAYGHTEQSFFQHLLDAKIDVLCDIRQRRGMRGSTYAFLNSTRLQQRLHDVGIEYRHIKELAPSTSIRDRQKVIDAQTGISKTQRIELSQEFRTLFQAEVLEQLEPRHVLAALPPSARRPCFFCVERSACACHRSLVADWLRKPWSTKVVNLAE